MQLCSITAETLVNNSQHFHVLHWVDECVHVAHFYQGLSGMLMITLGAR